MHAAATQAVLRKRPAREKQYLKAGDIRGGRIRYAYTKW
jgi:hypothetical protein